MFGEDFIQYDFKRPLKLSQDLRQRFDIVVADPPYLTEECLSKTVQTIKYLAKDKVLLCTGESEVFHFGFYSLGLLLWL